MPKLNVGAVQVFRYTNGVDVRIIPDDHLQLWFALADIGKALDIAWTIQLLQDMPRDWKIAVRASGDEDLCMIFINYPGVLWLLERTGSASPNDIKIPPALKHISHTIH